MYGLDRHITGNYGEDQYGDEPEGELADDDSLSTLFVGMRKRIDLSLPVEGERLA